MVESAPMERHFSAERLEKLRKILLLLVPLVYAAVLSFSFSGEWFPADDQQELVFVRGLSSTGALFGADVFGLFRPVKNLLFRLFVAMSPFGVDACRLVGIAIGIGSFFPVLALCRRILGNEWKAILAASVWLLSPTLVSSAAWLSCANIQLMVAFAALSMVVHDAAWNDNAFHPERIVFAGLFLFLALVSYESAIALVPILFLFDFYLRPNRIRSHSAWTAYGTYAGVAAAYLLLRHAFRASTMVDGSFTEIERWQLVVSSPWFTWQHFASWFWPFGRFTVFGSYQWGQASWTVLVSCAVLFLALLAFAIAARKKLPSLSFSVLFALFAFAPVNNCLGLKNGPYGDYYLTLASIGIATGCVEAVFLLSSIKGRFRTGAIAVVFAFVFIRLFAVSESARWAHLWSRGDLALSESIRNFPDSFSNKILAATSFYDAGRQEEALEFGRQVELVVGSESSRMCGIHLMRAIHAIRVEKNAEKALDEIGKSVPNDGLEGYPKNRHFYRGCVFEDLAGDEAAAEAEYETALAGQWTIDLVPCADRLARLRAIRGDLNTAIPLWEKATKLDPGNESVLRNLSTAYRAAGEIEKSEDALNRAKKLGTEL